jgi:hypothetical protein
LYLDGFLTILSAWRARSCRPSGSDDMLKYCTHGRPCFSSESPLGWKKNLCWAGGAVLWASCIFPLGPAAERLRVEEALVFRGGWLVSAFE